MTDKFIPSTQLIEKLPDICVNLELISVYDMNCYSTAELIYKLAQKINDTIVNMNHNDEALKAQLDDLQIKLEYLLGEGLTAELQKIIEKMYADGSLQALVEGAMVDINKRLTALEDSLYYTTPEMFNGSIVEAITACTPGGTVYLSKDYTVEDTIIIDKNINFIVDGVIKVAHTGCGIRFKDLGRGTDKKCNHKINIIRTIASYEATSIGIEINSCYNQKFNIAYVSGFETGLLMTADLGKGCVYNNLDLGELVNNKRQIALLGIKDGDSDIQKQWINQNTFIGGRIYWTGSLTTRTDCIGILIGAYGSKAYVNNGNAFFNTSIEDVGVSGSYAKAIYCGGHSNTFHAIRVEGSKTFEFSNTSFNNKMYGGVYTYIENITDNGARNEFDINGGGCNKYAKPNTTSNKFIGGGIDTPAIELQNVGSENYDVLRAYSPTGVLKYAVGGNGFHMFKDTVKHSFGLYNAAPTSGEWNRNDIVWRNNPSAGGNVGWICVASGTPGTWKAFGTIES